MIIKNFNYKCVNSTNDIAINLIKNKNLKAGFIVAEKQKKGRGQRGKKWIRSTKAYKKRMHSERAGRNNFKSMGK